MRKYGQYFRISFQRTFMYRGQLFIFTLASLLAVVPLLAVWLGYSGDQVAGFSRNELIIYYVAGLFMQRLIYSSLVNYYVAEIVSDGSITGLFLTKPLNFFLSLLMLGLGWTVVSVFFGFSISTIVAFILTNGIPLEFSTSTIILSALSAFLAMLLVYSTSLLLGLISFWTVHISSFVSLYWIALIFLSGVSIPLSFFPRFLKNILDINPFRFMFSFPIEIFLNKLSFYEMSQGFLLQLLWIVVAVITYHYVWKRATRVYSGYGQ